MSEVEMPPVGVEPRKNYEQVAKFKRLIDVCGRYFNKKTKTETVQEKPLKYVDVIFDRNRIECSIKGGFPQWYVMTLEEYNKLP